jgi:hypothetical protein
MLFKESGGYSPIASIARILPRGEEACTILQQGRELPLEMDAPAELIALLTAPVVPAAPGFAILRDNGVESNIVADPVVAWRITATKAHPVGLCDQEKNRDFVRSADRFRALRLPDGTVLADNEVVYASPEEWRAANARARAAGA